MNETENTKIVFRKNSVSQELFTIVETTSSANESLADMLLFT